MEKFFWADAIADKLIKEKKGKKILVCASGITPSGVVHIGNFREVITTELVVRALKDRKKKVRFLYSWDDYDRLRKVPQNLPESEKEKYYNYIGMPLSEIPSPFEKNKSYAWHFEKEFENECKKVFVKPEFIRQNHMYKKCKYAQLIKKAIDEKKEIVKILNKYRKEPLEKNWMPIEVYCEKCKKDTTKILNVKNYEIEYSCSCMNRGKFDFRKKGIVKLKWRIDWPMRWSYEKVDFEPGGNDHSVYGGSFMTAKEIVKIFDYEAPMYVMYDFVSIKGTRGKISSSAGNTLTVSGVEKVYEPEIIRWLFVGTRPNKGFEISFDNDVIKLYEDFDELERKYYEKEANQQEKRIYELSVVNVKKKKPERMSFRHLITLIQTGKTRNLNEESKKRTEKVKNWLENYASDDFKFEIKDKIEFELDDKQKQALKILKESLSVKKFTEAELFQEFQNICNAVGINKQEFFEGAYSAIIGKSQGPRLSSLILTIGKEKIIKLLEQIK
ncbi:MAG: lysine--tRNA ligase [archaeon]